MERSRVIVIILIVVAIIFFAVLIGLFAWGAIGTAREQSKKCENIVDAIDFLSDAGSDARSVVSGGSVQPISPELIDNGAGVEPPANAAAGKDAGDNTTQPNGQPVEQLKTEEVNNSRAQFRAFDSSLLLELPIKPVNDFGMTVGRVYKGVVLDEYKLPLIDCINKCRENQDCVGVNHRRKDNTCQLMADLTDASEDVDWSTFRRQA